MLTSQLAYPKLVELLAPYKGNGRQESANFLSWFLSNIYRLDDVTADDAVCDKSNDKGIDGIYVDDNAQEIHFFQSKIKQKETSSIGDRDIKQLIASTLQFDTPDKIGQILDGNANPELKKIIIRHDLVGLIEKGYRVKPVFVANTERDINTVEIEEQFPDLEVYAASDIVDNYIEFDADEGIKGEFEFDTSYAGVIELTVEERAIVYVLPVSATSLVKLAGISDGTLFSQNVRYSLGNTPVNKAISKSVADTGEHPNFALYHNGVTLICHDAEHDPDTQTLRITDYVVVNGAQSITTFYHNNAKLSDDLRVFTKVISLQSEGLSRKITINSNNQNAIKPRDLRSNHDLMLRLRAEFEEANCNYQFEIKRGQSTAPGLDVITNDLAGRALLAFDLNEPYSSHQIYRVFDDKYSNIFGRREVTYGRIIFMKELYDLITDALGGLSNPTMARYALTRYFMIYVIGNVIRLFPEGREFLADTDRMNDAGERKNMLATCREVLEGMVVDLDYEIEDAGEMFDYKKVLKSPEAVKEWRDKLLRTYEKDFKRGKAAGFGEQLNKESALNYTT